MKTQRRIQKALDIAETLNFDDKSKIVIFSDIHRGDGGRADNFEPNKLLYLTALRHYFKDCFTYIELGDGDELWENPSFKSVVTSHNDVFDLLAKFYENKRLHFIFGNHDIRKKDDKWVSQNMTLRYDNRVKHDVPMFPDIRVHESMLLCHKPSGGELFLLHGHQADFFNDTLWPLSAFLCRFIWRPFESIGIQNPTSAATNDDMRNSVEGHLMNFASRKKLITVAGHTHRARFPAPHEPPYFNDGSCVRNGHITALEITEGKISLVKWIISVREDDALTVNREIMEGPIALAEYFKAD